jgi:hypothetical protein
MMAENQFSLDVVSRITEAGITTAPLKVLDDGGFVALKVIIDSLGGSARDPELHAPRAARRRTRDGDAGLACAHCTATGYASSGTCG